jgi:hypothetical protein
MYRYFFDFLLGLDSYFLGTTMILGQYPTSITRRRTFLSPRILDEQQPGRDTPEKIELSSKASYQEDYLYWIL